MSAPAETIPVPGFFAGTFSILRKELRVMFVTPLAYVFLAAFLCLGGLFFFLGIAGTGEASMRPVMGNLAVILLFCLPLVTMRSLADETRTGTLELLMTSPIPLGSIIVGKWLATLALCLILLVFTAIYPLILAIFGEPDWGAVFTSYVGLALVCAAFSAAGLFVSSTSRDQMVAGVGTVMLLLPFWLADGVQSMAPQWLTPVLERVSLLGHLRGFSKGVLDSGDIIWFVGFTVVFLF
jgi:ABC-2 type transport system permease protein